MNNKTLTRLIEQKPRWIVIDEPVSASTDANQDTTVLPDGTIISNVEGVANRTSAQLWGSVKLLSDILAHGHQDDGTHSLKDADIAADAAINETKINLTYVGESRPSGGVYATGKDLADEINTWVPFYRVSTNHSAISRGKERADMAQNFHKNGYVDFTVTPNGRQSRFLVADDERVWIKGHKITLTGVNSDNTECYIDLGAAPSAISVAITDQIAVWLEVWEHNATQAGFLFPYGNTQYKNESVTDSVLDYAHTSETISVTDYTTLPSYLANPDHNLFMGVNGDLWQVVYKVRFKQVEYSAYDFGLNDPGVKTLTGQSLTKIKNVSSLWGSVDGTLAMPLAVVIRRNQGVYHPAINPAGCAVKRKGKQTPTSLLQCYDQTRIGYFNNAVECPDYGMAVYDSVADTYTFGNVVYIRSSLKDSGVTARPDGCYSDEITVNDVDVIKPKYIVEHRISGEYIGKLLTNQIRNCLNPVIYGTSSSQNYADCWGVNPLQVIGLGVSEAATFGTNNIGGLFIDQTNNYKTGFIDGVRTVWSDREVTRQVAFTFVQGNGSSESKPMLNTYEPVSRTVSLNTTGLSGLPLVGTDKPTMLWEDGTAVVLSTDWSGLGTESAACTIDAANSTAHAGQTVYAVCDLTYARGSGVPFVLDRIVHVEDAAGHALSWSYLSSPLTLTRFVVPTAGSVNTVTLPQSASSVDGFYNGMWLVVSSSANVTSGVQRQITSYDATTKMLTLSEPMPAVLAGDSVVSISELAVENYPHIQFDSYARGIHRALRRGLFTANAQGRVAVGKHILSASAGTVNKVLITGLTANQIVDVVFEEDAPFTTSGLKIWIYNTDTKYSYQTLPTVGSCKIIDIGKSLITNLGSGNNGDSAYLHLIPGSSTPYVDNHQWVGTVDLVDNQAISLVDNQNLSWENIIPYAGLTLDYSTLETDVRFNGNLLQLISASHVLDNSGMILSSMLVYDENGYKLLVAQTTGGVLTFADRSKVWVVDLAKLISYTDLV